MNAAEEASKDRATASLFPEIGELVPIGDGRSAALVGPDGAVEFFCPLRFDAPALVFPILDRLRGGRLRVGPVESPGTRLSCRRHYRQASSVLTLEWFGASGSARMHMALKWLPQEQEQEQEQEILWLLEGLDGSMEAEVVLAPSPGFGANTVDLDVSVNGAFLHHSDFGAQGGFNWSSQHLDREVFSDGDGGLEQEDQRSARECASAVACGSGVASAYALARAA